MKGIASALPAILLLLLVVVSFYPKTPAAQSESEPDVTVTADYSKAFEGFDQRIAGGANIAIRSKEDLPLFLDQVGSDLLRLKIYTWLVNEEMDNYFEADGIDYGADLKKGVDEIHATGGKAMIQLYGVPSWLSTCDFANNPDCNKFLCNAIPDYSKYPPSDYNKWQELVRGMVERLNELSVSVDYFEIYGEPNLCSTWWGGGSGESIPSFLEHYNKTVQAIRSVNPNAKVGGAAFAVWSLSPGRRETLWITSFIEYVKQNNVPLDFFSWHLYSPRTDLFKSNAKDLRNYLDSKELSIPIFFTEWNIAGSKELQDKASTHFGSSFGTAALIEISQSENNGQTYYTLTDSNAVKFGLLTSGHQPKASFNAFKLFSMLKGKGMQTTTDEIPYTINLGGGIEQRDIRALAAQSAEEVSLIATYYVPIKAEDSPRYNLSKRVKIIINNVPFKEYSYKIYLIDKNHSNIYFGSGPELELLEAGTGSGSFQKTLDFQIYGTVLVGIENSCTVKCSSNAECSDTNSLTKDICLNAGTCSAACSNTLYPSCAEIIAAECACSGNIYSSGLCCSNLYRAQASCSTDLQCGDQNSLTNDACLNSGTCSASCANTPIQEPICANSETTACVTTDICTGTRICSNNTWGDCLKDNPKCPISIVCVEGKTQNCATSDGCSGTQTCISNSWTDCLKLDAGCPTTGLDTDGDGLLAAKDCNDRDASIGICTGCAVCSGGKCVAGSCPSTYCPESACIGEDYYEYPANVPNSCTIEKGHGTCTSIKCTPAVSAKDSKCTMPLIQKTLTLQVLGAAVVAVAIAGIIIAWALRKK